MSIRIVKGEASEEEIPLDECQFFDEPPEEEEEDEEEDGPPQKKPKRETSTKRRVYHNEIERQRRTKINTWITELGKLVVDEDEEDDGKAPMSKIQILEKACQLLETTKQENEEIKYNLKRTECEVRMLKLENDKLKLDLKRKNK